MPSLRPAVLYRGKRYVGTPDDTHPDVMKAHDIGPDARHVRGFVNPQGRFLTRPEAKLWLKQFDPETYKRWTETNDQGARGELHSEDLQQAEEKPETVSLKNKTCIVYDLGLWTENARRLARDCAKVIYFVPWAEAFSEPFKRVIGEGLEGLTRIDDFWSEVDKADFVFIPDNQCAGITEYLKAHGYPTAGAGNAERIELDRWYGRGIQEKNGLPVQETYRVKGVTALREFVKSHKNMYVKVDNQFRGIEESFKYTDYRDVEPTIDHMAYKLGHPYKESIWFTIEELLDGEEPGLDGITWDGELLYPTMGGYERKGVGIIERTYRTEAELPEAIKMIDAGLAPEFKKHKTRFFYSTEFKIGKDRVPYLIDPTIRLAGPGTSAIQSEAIDNYSEVVYGMATGRKVRPVIRHKYAAACAFHSEEANKAWVNITVPEKVRQWVKFRRAVRKDEDYYAVPGFDSLGTVVGLGNTVDEAIGLVEDRMKDIDAKRIDKGIEQLKQIKESIAKGKEYGIDF